MAKDWIAQAEEVVQHWTSAQRKMWESWFEAMQNLSCAPRSSEGWEYTVEHWNRAVKSALESQFAWTRFWANSVQTHNTPAPIVAWSQELVKMMERWTETQLELSESWFATIKQSNPTTVALVWDRAEAERVVRDWQEATRTSLEAQLNWLRVWTSVQAHWYIQQEEQSGPDDSTEIKVSAATGTDASTLPAHQPAVKANPPDDTIQPVTLSRESDAPPDMNNTFTSTASAIDNSDPSQTRTEPEAKAEVNSDDEKDDSGHEYR